MYRLTLHVAHAARVHFQQLHTQISVVFRSRSFTDASWVYRNVEAGRIMSRALTVELDAAAGALGQVDCCEDV